ncbi:MAG TPA: PKD domain-containing protein [Thermoanaerobaculia bacterium]|jgi:hypothetical protein
MSTRAVACLILLTSLLPVVGCDKATPVAPGGTILAISANPTRIAVNGTSTITVIGRKPDGNPLNPGTEIRMTASLGSIASIITTGSNGTATATFQANGQLGTATITAQTGAAAGGTGGGGTSDSTGSSSGTLAASVQVQVGNAAKTIVLQPTPTTIPATGGTVKLLAIVRDSSGQPLAGQGVDFTTDLGTLASRGGIVYTNSQGEARDTLNVSASDLQNNATAIHVTVESAGGDGALVNAMSTIQVATGRPMAHFTYSVFGSDKRVVQFHNASTGSGTLSYMWDFGDGSAPSSEQNPVHTYTADKSYTVTLTVTDSNNQASVSTATFTIPLSAGGSSTP